MLRGQNKRGVSEVIGYVLLIVIAVGLSAGVYSFLKIYIPKERVSCADEITLGVQHYSCTASLTSPQLNLTIVNRGLFKADAAYIRFGNLGAQIKERINKDSLYFFMKNSTGASVPGLNPGGSFSFLYGIKSPRNLASLAPTAGDYELEIEPAIIVGKTLVACEKSIITVKVSCK